MSNRISVWGGNLLQPRQSGNGYSNSPVGGSEILGSYAAGGIVRKIGSGLNLKSGLVAYYNFGNNVLDSSGNALHLMPANNLNYTNVYGEGFIGKYAMYFSTQELVTRSLSSYIPGTIASSIFTISGWWLPDVATESGGAGNFLLANNLTTETIGLSFLSWNSNLSTNELEPFNVYGLSLNYGVIYPTLRETWNHFTMVKNVDSITIYINGNIVTTLSNSLYEFPDTSNLRLSLATLADYETKWDGLALHNRALSHLEVKALYNNGFGIDLSK